MSTGASRQPADSDLVAGQQVGEYVIESKLGEGGFGTVFRASHPLIGKLAAVKVLSRRYSADEEIVSRFVSEARAVNQIRHRNIIDIFSFGQLDDGRCYYVMELLEGEPLDAYIDDTGGMPLGEALPVLRAIGRALDAAHVNGIAHRDLKPENVFLAREPDGTAFPKLLDFGIAKLLGDAGMTSMHRTRTGSPIGTPYYMSPEQCRGEAVDHRTDIYSFGCLAYQLLTGSLPFEGENHLEVLMKQTSEEPVPASVRAADNPALPPLPPEIDAAIAWMMKKAASERPPNLAAAVHALEEAAGIEVVPETVVRRSSPKITPGVNRTPAHGVTALAQTVAAASSPPVRARRRWLVPAIIAISGAAGAIVFAAMRGGDAPVAPPPSPPPVVAPAAVPTPAPQPAPPAPRFVTIHVTDAPAGTRVFGPQGPLGVAPGDIQLPRGDDDLQLTFEADGYIVKTTKVSPLHDATLAVALVRKPAARSIPQQKPATARKPPPAAPPKADPYGRE